MTIVCNSTKGAYKISRYHRRETPVVNQFSFAQNKGYFGERSKSYPGRRGARPEKAAPGEFAGYFERHKKVRKLVETEPEYDNIFYRYDIGNKDLPAANHEQELFQHLEADKVFIISGATGSGKTTQVPQMALKAGYDRVIVLQPRRVNASAAGDRVEAEIRSVMGDDYPEDLVGVNHSARNTITPNSKVMFMTADTFTNRLLRDQKLWADEKVLIIADETHENGSPTEFACAFGLQAVEKYEGWRMAYASATPDEVLGGNTAISGVNGKAVSAVHIEGRPQNLEVLEDSKNDIVNCYIEHSKGRKKAMIFVEGIPAAEKALSSLQKAMTAEERSKTKFFILSSETTEAEQLEIMSVRLHEDESMVVVSTATGQTGITIPGLDLVVMSGVVKSPEVDEEIAEGLPIRFCTQAELLQQAGRTGRDAPGIAVLASPIVSENMRLRDDSLFKFKPIHERDRDMPPEVYHTNVARNALRVAAMGQDFYKTNLYMKNPLSANTINEANGVLFSLGALNQHDRVTKIGRRMDRYSLRPELSRAMVELETGNSRETQVQGLAIAAAIENGGLASYSDRDAWMDFLNFDVADDYMAQLQSMAYAKKHSNEGYLNYGALRSVGISPASASKALKHFDKMRAQIMGPASKQMDITLADENQKIILYDAFLRGMPELIFTHTETRRKTPYYENRSGFQSPLERVISNRSVLAKKIGNQAAKFIVGFPRWYTENGAKRDIIEFGFPVERADVKRILGHMATRSRKPEVRGGQLINVGGKVVGGVEFEESGSEAIIAVNSTEVGMLVKAAKKEKVSVIKFLNQLNVSEKDIDVMLREGARGAGNIHDLNSKVWSIAAKIQSEKLQNES